MVQLPLQRYLSTLWKPPPKCCCHRIIDLQMSSSCAIIMIPYVQNVHFPNEIRISVHTSKICSANIVLQRWHITQSRRLDNKSYTAMSICGNEHAFYKHQYCNKGILLLTSITKSSLRFLILTYYWISTGFKRFTGIHNIIKYQQYMVRTMHTVSTLLYFVLVWN